MKHRHIIETIVTLMTTANLAQDLWFHTYAHSVFLINRMPCKTLNMQSLGSQLLFGVVHSIQGLKIYGTAVYPYVRPYTHNKLQPRATLCVFLGYASGYKGVNCYHLHSRKFIISRHVIHDESHFPCKSSTGTVHSSPISESQISSHIHRSVNLLFLHLRMSEFQVFD